VAALSVPVPSVPIMRRGIAVEANSDPNIKAREELQIPGIQAHSIGLQADIDSHLGTRPVSDTRHYMGDQVRTREQWLTSVHDDGDPGEVVGMDMFGDSRRGLVRDGPWHPAWAKSPSLVRQLVHVTVVTRQVTPTMDLEYEFPEGRRFPAVRAKGLNVERQGPFGFWRRRTNIHFLLMVRRHK
jgi:hypothetical protein